MTLCIKQEETLEGIHAEVGQSATLLLQQQMRSLPESELEQLKLNTG